MIFANNPMKQNGCMTNFPKIYGMRETLASFQLFLRLVWIEIFVANFFLRIFANRKQMRSMDFYKDAVVAADEQKDCAVQYPDCTYTLVDKVGKWVST